MKKKYNCRLSASSLLVNVKGKVLRLELEPDVIDIYGTRGCSYATEDKDIQHAIEHHARTKSVDRDRVWTNDVESKEEVKEEKVVLTSNPAAAPTVKKTVVRRYKAKKEA